MQPALDYLQALNLEHTDRYLLGITGAPGAGKSFAANKLKEDLNSVAHKRYVEVLGMDGFHYSDEELKQINLYDLKGVPDSFDKKGFLNKLQELNFVKDQIITAPTFNRAKECVQEDSLMIEPRHTLIIVEGNYLLLEDDTWCDISNFLNEIWYLESDLVTIRPRLIARHSDKGKDERWVINKVNYCDIPNAKLVDSTRHLANKILFWENSQLYVK